MGNDIWGWLSYILAVFIAVFLVAWKLPKHNHFYLRLCLSLLVLVGYEVCFQLIRNSFSLSGSSLIWVLTSDAFIIFLFGVFSVFVCFGCNVWGALFCGTAGYCMQHMSQRSYSLLTLALPADLSPWLLALLLIVITAFYYFIIYYFFIRKMDYHEKMLDSKVQICVAFFVVLIDIYLNSFAFLAAAGSSNSKVLKAYIMVFSIVCAMLALFVEFGWLLAKNMEVERNIVERILSDGREQYRIEKETSDLINIKAHDLKHQLAGAELDATAKSKIDGAVASYDAFLKTGNEALDVVLTLKRIVCEKRGIRLTCMVNGPALDFMEKADIYSLFGNMLDNAIEATEKLAEPEKRVITLGIEKRGEMVFVHEENYMAGTLTFENGKPQTTKADHNYHGFGLQSMMVLAKQYQGECKLKAKDGVFSIDLMFAHPKSLSNQQ